MFRIGLCQMKGSFDKKESMKTAEASLERPRRRR